MRYISWMKGLWLTLVLMLAAGVSVEVAAQGRPDAINLENNPDSLRKMVQELRGLATGFNGAEHVLQKPAENEKYPNKKFGDHLFLMGEAGITMDRSQNSWFSSPGLGMRAGVQVGDWFTPVHGMRVGLNAGRHNGGAVSNPFFVGLSADYLMNLSSLLRKENLKRRFELIAAFGLEYQALFQHYDWSHAGGFRFGLQPRLNFTPMTFFFVEPRIGFYTDKIDGIDTWRGYDWEASILGGFGYRLQSEPYRKNSPFGGVGRGWYLSAGAGVTGVFDHGFRMPGELGPAGLLAVGNQLTPISSVRLGAMGRYIKTGLYEANKYSLGVQLDYLLNFHSAFGGYDPNRVFELSGVLGAGYHVNASNNMKNDRFTLGAGVHGDFHVHNNWSLFLEPRVDFYPNMSWDDSFNSYIDPIPTVLAGVTYYPVSRDVAKYPVREPYELPSAIGDIYVTAGAGLAMPLASSESNFFPYLGARLSAGLGTRWSSTSGARLLANVTCLQTPYGMPYTAAIGAQLDYILYMNSLAWGNNHNSHFELNGVVGLNYDYILMDHRYRHTLGAGVGLQGVYRINEMFGLFVEPRLNVAPNNHWEKGMLEKLDVLPTVTLGLNYDLYGYGKRNGRPKREEFITDNFAEHVFYGMNVGAVSVLSRNLIDHPANMLGGMATAYLGKWFTGASGARVSLGGGAYGEYQLGHRIFAVAELDYLWNINTTLYGYRPDRIFTTSLSAGPALAFSTGRKFDFYLGAGVGLQGAWKLNEGLRLVAEPQLRFFHKNISAENVFYLPDMFGSFSVGLQYQLDRYDYRTNRVAYESSDKYFVSTALLNSKHDSSVGFATGHGGYLALGKWYTPLSAWRIGLDMEYYHEDIRMATAALSADYLFNLTAFTMQYNPNRVFDLIALCGVRGGVAYRVGKSEAIYGLKAGLQGKFRLSPRIDFFLEPEALMTHIPQMWGSDFEPELRLLAGVNYKLGHRQEGNRRVSIERKNELSLSAAPTVFCYNDKEGRSVSFGADFSYGHWFNSVSGLQLGVGYDGIPRERETTLKVTSAKAGYMLDLTSLLEPMPDRKFHLVATVGAGLGWSDYSGKTKMGWLGEGRMKLRWDLGPVMSCFIEPSITLWSGKIYKPVAYNYMGVARLSAGLSCRF